MRHVVKIKFLLMTLFCIILLFGCAQREGEQSVSQDSDEFVIVTSFYPVYISTINIAGGIPGVDVINMTQPQTGCLHDYQLSPRDLKILEEADVFVINGAGMESFLDKVIDNIEGIRIIDASSGIELLQNADGTENPHVWVSITNAITQIDNISRQLALADAGHAGEYAANAAAYADQLRSLRERMHLSLDNLENRDIITFHEAFPYFAQEFGLNIKAVIEREPGTAPAPKEFEEIISLIKTSGIRVIFTEPQYPAKPAEMIANETGAVIYRLDPMVTGVADENAADDYISKMEANLEVLMEALN